jgi:hypothetical protein
MNEKQTRLPVDARRRRLVMGLAAVAVLAVLAGVVAAQESDQFDLSWYTLDGGSGVQAGTQYGLAGTVGEPLPGRASGRYFGMTGGYDPAAPEAVLHHVYLPVVFRLYSP